MFMIMFAKPFEIHGAHCKSFGFSASQIMPVCDSVDQVSESEMEPRPWWFSFSQPSERTQKDSGPLEVTGAGPTFGRGTPFVLEFEGTCQLHLKLEVFAQPRAGTFEKIPCRQMAQVHEGCELEPL